MSNATWLANVLRAARLNVVEHDGWRTAGRPGAFDPKGVLCHHTGKVSSTSAAVNLIQGGRPDLPGPLSQLMLDRDGTFHVIAAGRCNHAGRGKWQGLTNGNRDFIGIEARNDGTGEDWPDVQLDAYVRGCAAMLDHMGADAVMAAGHKEYALPKGRKVDPSLDMLAFRERVQAVMTGVDQQPRALPVAVNPERAMLRKGDHGPSVKQLQKLLGVAEDGNFGPKTEGALKAFQRDHGLLADGLAGPKTWAALEVK